MWSKPKTLKPNPYSLVFSRPPEHPSLNIPEAGDFASLGIHLLPYADDKYIIRRSKQIVSFVAIERESTKIELQVIEGKIKYLLHTSRNVTENELIAETYISKAAEG